MEIGVINGLHADRIGNLFDNVREFGLKTCQLAVWDETLFTEETARAVERRQRESGVRVCALWAGWPAPHAWNFTEGPITLGLVPPEYRAERIRVLRRAADFAAAIGAPAVVTHCGFIPENLTDPLYDGTVVAIRTVAECCKAKNLGFWFETGQETPVTLLRTIERVGTGNLGVNLDPANLLLYGKGNPIDALEVFGKYVRNVHVKDGMLPTDGQNLGRETRVGEGRVNFPAFLRRLREIGFDGELIIEREIPEGEEQRRDILGTVEDVQRWWKGE